jgi:hypothetical protein
VCLHSGGRACFVVQEDVIHRSETNPTVLVKRYSHWKATVSKSFGLVVSFAGLASALSNKREFGIILIESVLLYNSGAWALSSLLAS